MNSNDHPEAVNLYLPNHRVVTFSNLSMDRLGIVFQLFQLRYPNVRATVSQETPPAVQFLSKLKPAYLRAFSFSSKPDWYKYINTNPLTPWMIRNAELLDYIRSGIPNEFRGTPVCMDHPLSRLELTWVFCTAFLWQVSCGGFYFRYDSEKSYSKYTQMTGTSEAIAVIERVSAIVQCSVFCESVN
jgi:hypothetical protein